VWPTSKVYGVGLLKEILADWKLVLAVAGAALAGIGMVAYAFTPYAIQFSSHTSVLLPPWAAMPWFV